MTYWHALGITLKVVGELLLFAIAVSCVNAGIDIDDPALSTGVVVLGLVSLIIAITNLIYWLSQMV